MELDFLMEINYNIMSKKVQSCFMRQFNYFIKLFRNIANFLSTYLGNPMQDVIYHTTRIILFKKIRSFQSETVAMNYQQVVTNIFLLTLLELGMVGLTLFYSCKQRLVNWYLLIY